MAEKVLCPECKKQGVDNAFTRSGLVGHLRMVHQIEPKDQDKDTELLVAGPAGAQKPEVMAQKAKVAKTPVEMQQGDDGQTFFPITMWLPADLFALYYHARESGLSDHKTLVDFVVEYTYYGFKKAHEGYGLTLAQVEKKPGDIAAEEIAVFREQMRSQQDSLNNLSQQVGRLLEQGKVPVSKTDAKKK
jgi:hypothetical protein